MVGAAPKSPVIAGGMAKTAVRVFFEFFPLSIGRADVLTTICRPDFRKERTSVRRCSRYVAGVA